MAGEQDRRIVLRIGPPQKLEVMGILSCPSLSRDGKTLAVVDGNKGVLVDLEKCTEKARLDFPSNLTIALSPDGRWAATGPLRSMGTGITKVWDARTGMLVKELPSELIVGDSCVAFSADSRWLVTATQQEFRYWKAESWEPAGLIIRERAQWPPSGPAFTRDGTMMAIAISPNMVQLRDTGAGQEIARLVTPDPQSIYTLRFSADGSCLAAGRDNQVVTVWDLRQIRKQLAAIGLDWERPPFRPQSVQLTGPLQAEVDLGAQWHREQAAELIKSGNWAAAIVHLNRFVREAPITEMERHQHALAYDQIGWLYEKLNNRILAELSYRRAVALFEKLVADFPDVAEHRKVLSECLTNLGILLMVPRRLPAAEAAHRRAIDHRAELAAKFPGVPAYHSALAGSYVNLGIAIRDQGKPEASLEWFAKAIALLETLLNNESVPARQYLRNAHWSRVQALNKLARFGAAVKDWDRILALNTVPAEEPSIRFDRAVSLARAGDHAKAVAEANALAQAKDVQAIMLYNLACICAIASSTVKDDVMLREQYAARAVELLGQAIAKGFNNFEHIKKDDDLKSLRERGDYKKLLKE
jgi:tetratricopeptide (TPR) repeat protein